MKRDWQSPLASYLMKNRPPTPETEGGRGETNRRLNETPVQVSGETGQMALVRLSQSRR